MNNKIYFLNKKNKFVNFKNIYEKIMIKKVFKFFFYIVIDCQEKNLMKKIDELTEKNKQLEN